MELIPYTDADMALTEALECDPGTMAHLGGPQPREKIPEIHRRRLGYIAHGAWHLKIVPDASGVAAGTIGIWDSEREGVPIKEMGWMVLPAFRGRGLATQAGRMILERARARGDAAVHAFPTLSNVPSNALCRALGFSPLEECGVDYAGRALRCRHWRIDLR